MGKKPKILVVGSFIMDLIARTTRVPNEGETVVGFGFSTAPGGKGANQAAQAALLGADVTMVGKVGCDIFGEELINSVKKFGINTQYIKKDPNSSSGVGNVTLEVKERQKAKNRILIVPGANMSTTVDEIEFLRDIISDFDMVMLQLEIPMEVNEAVVDIAFEKGVPVMLNSAPSAPLKDEMIRKLTYISPNEYEAADLTDVKIKRTDDGVDMESAKEAASVLLNKGVKNVIITLGSNGSIFMNHDKFIYQPCIDIVKVVDPTAAGDSFIGAFSTAVCSGKTEEDALKFASYAATITVSRMGAQPSLPNLREVIELMELDQKQCLA